jgi:hypothetical protein
MEVPQAAIYGMMGGVMIGAFLLPNFCIYLGIMGAVAGAALAFKGWI